MKKLITVFKIEENSYSKLEMHNHAPFPWRERKSHALTTHSDESTKFDLPSIIVEATSDISRFRFDSNANCNPITENAVVLSHEQGSGKERTASTIIQTILIDHLLTCRGESLKIIVADCASVGRCWLTTVCLPQYMVDQHLADIVLVMVFDNCHGKYLTDQLFGHVQRRRKRSTVLGIDALLGEFEKVKKRNGGSVSGFAINPLSSIDFVQVFSSLGYSTTPHADLGFNRRNIHFAAACRAGASDALNSEIHALLSPLLPVHEGMVRLSTEPPGCASDSSLRFENRLIDLLAANVFGTEPCVALNRRNPRLVVSLDTPYAGSGHGVVPARTVEKVGVVGPS